MPDYKETYNAVMSLPCVQRIVRKNDKLRKENKSLRNLIQSLPEFRNQSTCCCSSNRCYTDDTAVPIKIEKTSNNNIKSINIPVENIDSDSDIEIVLPAADFNENIVYDIIEESSETTEEEFDKDDEFKCETCSTVQAKNNCELCDVEDVCEECHGEGGDYGPNEIWVCHECLPTCLDCKSKLSTVYDICCRNRRSDDKKEDDVFGMDNEQVEDLIKEEVSEAVEEEEEDPEAEDSDSGESSYDDTQIRMAVLKSKKLDKDCLLGRLLGKSDMSDDKEEEEEEKEKEKEKEEEEEEESAEEEEEVEESAEEEEEEEEEEVEESAEEEEEEEEEESAEEEEVEESAEEEEEVEESAEEEEELEVFEITINGTEYYTTNENDGVIYAVDADSDVGDEIGKFVNKKPVFY